MDELKDEQIQQLKRTLQEYQNLLKEAREVSAWRSGNSHASFNINGGEIFTTIATFTMAVCCTICAVLFLVQHSEMADIKTKMDRTQDYLNAIYMQAPQLKPKEGKN